MSNRKASKARNKAPSVAEEPVETPFSIENRPKIERVFHVFDHGNRKRVETQDIPIIVRALGLYPTDAEIEEIIRETEDSDFEGYVRQDAFVPVMLKVLEEKRFPAEPPEVLMQAFEIFDPLKRGYLEEELFRRIMTIEPEDEDGTREIENELEKIHASMAVKVSLSDEKLTEEEPVPLEEVDVTKKRKPPVEEEEIQPQVVEKVLKVEPLNSDELCELMKVALDKDTGTVIYGDLILKFLACQHFKETSL